MPSVSPQPKDEIVTVRVSAEDLELWRAAAEAADMKLADWIRRQCKAAATKKKR